MFMGHLTWIQFSENFYVTSYNNVKIFSFFYKTNKTNYKIRTSDRNVLNLIWENSEEIRIYDDRPW